MDVSVCSYIRSVFPHTFKGQAVNGGRKVSVTAVPGLLYRTEAVSGA